MEGPESAAESVPCEVSLPIKEIPEVAKEGDTNGTLNGNSKNGVNHEPPLDEQKKEPESEVIPEEPTEEPVAEIPVEEQPVEEMDTSEPEKSSPSVKTKAAMKHVSDVEMKEDETGDSVETKDAPDTIDEAAEEKPKDAAEREKDAFDAIVDEEKPKAGASEEKKDAFDAMANEEKPKAETSVEQKDAFDAMVDEEKPKSDASEEKKDAFDAMANEEKPKAETSAEQKDAFDAMVDEEKPKAVASEEKKDAFDAMVDEEKPKVDTSEEQKVAVDALADEEKLTKDVSEEKRDAFDNMVDEEKPAKDVAEEKKDAFDSIAADDKPKDAFDSMLSGESPKKDDSSRVELDSDVEMDRTELSVPDEPMAEPEPVDPEAIKSSSEEDVETDVETEEEIEVEVAFNTITSMVSHIIAPPDEVQMERKIVKKKVKRTVRRKKGLRKTRRGGPFKVVNLDDKPEEQWMKNVPSDEDYYANLDPEELEWFKEHGPKVETAGDNGLKCTSCFKQVTMILGSHTGMWRHAVLGVGVCKNCRLYYKDGDGWDKDEEGLDIFCRWCAEGGEIILCDKCPKAFCKRCIQRNLGRHKIAEITSAEEWKCFECDPKQLLEKKALYHAVWERFKSGNYKKPAELRRELKEAQDKKQAEAKQKKIDQMMKRPKNFVDENIGEAFKTLSVYQKCLEQERERWFKNGQQLNLTNATSICRALRKIYAITKQNMDLLDKAVVQSYVEHFPRESTRIHMGKVGIKVKDGSLTGKPTNIKGSTKVKLKTPSRKTPAPKKKVTPAPKRKSGGGGRTQEVVVLNGPPVLADPDDDDIFQVVRPSLSKKRAPGPASKRGRPMYTTKKTTRYEDSDSDVQVIGDSSDDDEPVSRKRKRTPVSSPAKKRRPGPKSRTGR